jgi:hypothetical protein
MLTKKNSTKQQRRELAEKQLSSKVNKMRISPPKRRKRVARKLATTSNKTSLMRNVYAMCRLRPFSTMGRSTGIPDSTNTRRLLLDHRMTNTFTFGTSGALNFAFVPSVPAPIWFYPNDSSFLINGNNYPNNVASTFFIPIHMPEWWNQAITYPDAAGDLDTVQTLFDSDKFRIVTAGWSIEYVGTTLTDSGHMVVTAFNQTLSASNFNPTTFNLYSYNSGTNTAYSANQVLIRPTNADVPALWFNGALAYDSVSVPLRKGASGVLRHSGATYEYRSLSRNQQFVASSYDTRNSMIMQAIPTPTIVADSGLVLGYDEGWDVTAISITGGTSGQSIIVDTIYCIEYCPTVASTSYSLARAGPKEQPGLLKSVDRAAQDLPLASIGSAIKTAISVGSVVRV